ncbi:hypothetical protein ACJDU8_21325 [Clostridium sp. WILCCON 0269]|uniref:Uncharacterized protein n=1 Tax=Candidatus Clostridium eludens TaxID=3381663 RepID=A0ABW8SPV1_9CLOT
MSDTNKILKQILNNQEQMQRLQEKMQEDINLIKIHQKEHDQILSSLKPGTEFHKSNADNLTHKNYFYSIVP